jgi:hypothetical protein
LKSSSLVTSVALAVSSIDKIASVTSGTIHVGNVAIMAQATPAAAWKFLLQVLGLGEVAAFSHLHSGTDTIRFSALKKVSQDHKLHMSDSDLQKMIDVADKDGDGEVNVEEFKQIWAVARVVATTAAPTVAPTAPPTVAECSCRGGTEFGNTCTSDHNQGKLWCYVDNDALCPDAVQRSGGSWTEFPWSEAACDKTTTNDASAPPQSGGAAGSSSTHVNHNSAVATWHTGHPGESCDSVCRRHEKVCHPEHMKMSTVTQIEAVAEHLGVTCNSWEKSTWIVGPFP